MKFDISSWNYIIRAFPINNESLETDYISNKVVMTLLKIPRLKSCVNFLDKLKIWCFPKEIFNISFSGIKKLWHWIYPQVLSKLINRKLIENAILYRMMRGLWRKREKCPSMMKYRETNVFLMCECNLRSKGNLNISMKPFPKVQFHFISIMAAFVFY